MSRLPFDPDRIAGPPPEPTPSAGRSDHGPARRPGQRFGNLADARQLTVTQATELIRATLEQRVPSPLRIIGQVSNFSMKEHWYFCLKDDKSVLHCAAWATSVRKFGFTPKDGDEVVATGHISHYGPQGRTQLYVSQLVPVGAGALELRFRALCEELRGLGYFAEERKKPLPVFPRRIAVITSATGAALHDVVETARQRCKAVGLLLVDVRVQGEGAAEEIARAIRWVDRNRKRLGVHALLVTRGGGSIEDLWAFNERIVADAVFGSHLPIVAAIGHESDTTIIELVADVRASTPTQAAMRLVPSAQELCRHVEHLTHRLALLLARNVERERRRLEMVRRRDAFRNPVSIVNPLRERLGQLIVDLGRLALHRVGYQRARLERLSNQLSKLQPQVVLAQREARVAVLRDRLQRAMIRRIDQRPRVRSLRGALEGAIVRHVRRQHDRVTALTRELIAFDPEGVLKRGYSITVRADGALVRSVHDATVGDGLLTRVADGQIESVVGSMRLQPPPSATPAPAASAARGNGPPARGNGRRKRTTAAADQMDLFGGAR